MELIRRDYMPDGTEIQFEEFGDGYHIGAYPIAKNTGKYKWVQKGETFRLTLHHFKDLEEAAGIYDGLRQGILQLTDFVDHYWNPIRDAYYMGLRDMEE